jgi:hypothetical protein
MSVEKPAIWYVNRLSNTKPPHLSIFPPDFSPFICFANSNYAPTIAPAALAAAKF